MKKSKMIKNTAFYSVSQILNSLIGFVFIMITTRIIGTGNYGLVALGISIRALFSNLGMFGMTFSSQKLLSGEFTSSKSSIFGNMIVINISVSILFALMLFIFCDYISLYIFKKAEFSIVLKFLGSSILFFLPSELLKSVMKSQNKAFNFFVITSIESLTKLFGLFLVLLIEDKMIGVLLALVISSFFSFTTGITLLVNDKILPTIKKLTIKSLSNIMKSSFGFLVVGLGYFLTTQVDKLMLGRLTTSSELGIYSIAASVAIIFQIFHSSMISVFMPTIAIVFKDKDFKKMKYLYNASNLSIAFINVVIFIFVVFLGDKILNSLFNTDDVKLFIVFCFLSLRSILGSISGPTGALLNMADKHKVEQINILLYLILNIFLNFILIRNMGVYGAVFATLISSVLLNIIQVIEIYKFYKLNILTKSHFILIISIIIILLLKFYYISDISTYRSSVVMLLTELIFISIFVLSLSKDFKSKIIFFIKTKLKSQNISN